MDTLQPSSVSVNSCSTNSFQIAAAISADVHDLLWSASLRGQETIRYTYIRRLCDFRRDQILAALSLADELGLRVI
jgi:heme oxygenase